MAFRLPLPLLGYLLWLLPWLCQAQNLVPNPSFEEYTDCPTYYTLTKLALIQDWAQPTTGTPDYFNTCSVGPMQVPNCEPGYQSPFTGKGFAGLFVFNILKSLQNYREYLQTKLKEPLQAGVTYQVSFRVSLSNTSHVAVDNLAAYFSVMPPSRSDSKLLSNLQQAPQVRNPTGKFLADTLNWLKIEGNFVANGGEQYLTLGNFDDNVHTNRMGTNPVSYYYIDDVAVYSCSQTINLGPDQTLCLGDSLLLEASLQHVTYRWQDSTAQATYTVKEPGNYWVEVRDKTTGCVYRDSIQISRSVCLEDLFIPNVITPNGDEHNQYFVIPEITNHWQIEIFNRLGEQIYRARVYKNDWSAQEQASGVYYYYLRNFVTGQSYKGWL